MIKLDKNWLTSGVLDIEYKQYELLGYLQKVGVMFDEVKLYPYFSDIIIHYEGLKEFKFSKKGMKDSFPKELMQINMVDLKLNYNELIIDGEYMNQLDSLVDFALKEFRKQISLGTLLFDEVVKCVDIVELGVIHTNSDRGYFILNDGPINVYEYELSKLYSKSSVRMLKSKLIRSYTDDLDISYESIRLDLVERSILINPSTFIVSTPINYPMKETLLPMTRRLLVKKLSEPALPLL